MCIRVISSLTGSLDVTCRRMAGEAALGGFYAPWRSGATLPPSSTSLATAAALGYLRSTIHCPCQLGAGRGRNRVEIASAASERAAASASWRIKMVVSGDGTMMGHVEIARKKRQ